MLPSFEYPGEEYQAFLRYSLNVNITTQKSNFSKSLLININAIPKKDEKNLNMESNISVKTWGFFSQGNAIFRASYPSKNYTFSDVIPIEVEIDNTSSNLAVTECKIRFLRRIILKNIEDFSEEYNKEKELMIDIHTIMVKKNEKKKYYYNINLQNLDFSNFKFENPYKNEKQLRDLMPSLDGSIIVCQYSVLVKLNYESYVTDSNRPAFLMPVYIINKIQNNKGEDNISKNFPNNIENNTLILNNIIDDDNFSLPSKSLVLNIEKEKEKEKEKENMKNNNNYNYDYNNKVMNENKINNNILNNNYNFLCEINNNNNNNNNDYDYDDDDDDNDLPSKSTLIRLKKEKKEKEEKEKKEKEKEEKKYNSINIINNKKNNSDEQNSKNNNNFLINNNYFYPDLDSNDINKDNNKDNIDLNQTMKILLKNKAIPPSMKNNNK